MATFNYTVDTHPMASELSSVSNHVTATTGAVLAMQTAVVFAEEQAADHVCHNVNKGFYSLIRSQISQKMAKYQSEVDSNIMQLNQQKIALLAIKDRMQRDYNMICARYTKLFNGLNSNLKLRVLELDRPSMDLALKENEKSSNRVKYLAASTTISQLESIKLGQTILGSNIKNKGFKVLNSMKTFLSDMILQKRRTESILINDNQPCNRSYFLPALLVETQIANQYGLHNDIYINSNLLSQSQQDLIRNNIRSKFQDGQWSKTDSINPELDKQFRNLCSDSRSNERIRKMALNLYESNLFYKI